MMISTRTTHPAAGRHTFGCEPEGVDARTCTAQDIHALKSLLFEHRLLVLRDQHLSPGDYFSFMSAWGTPIPHVLKEYTVQDHPSILTICDYVGPTGERLGVLDGGTYWHSDMSYLPQLGMATSLYAVRAGAESAGTAFVDLVAGLELLAGDSALAPLIGGADAPAAAVVHRFGNRRALTDPSAPRQALSREQHAQLPEVRHRLVEEHPITGRRALFAVAGSATELVDVPAPRSRELLDTIEDRLLAELPVHTHRYRPGDLVIWDNMSTLHRGVDVRPTADFERCRLLHRMNVHYADPEHPRSSATAAAR